MDLNEDAFSAGIKAGQDRAKMELLSDQALTQDLQEKIRGVLNNWPKEYHDRFVRLYVELCTIAEVARIVNGEPPLTVQDLKGFLRESEEFFNSFKHK